MAYSMLLNAWPSVNRVLPRSWLYALTNYRNSTRDTDQCFVIIGHTKAKLRERAIEQGLNDLRKDGGVEFVSLSGMASHAVAALASRRRRARRNRIQVKREYVAILGEKESAAVPPSPGHDPAGSQCDPRLRVRRRILEQAHFRTECRGPGWSASTPEDFSARLGRTTPVPRDVLSSRFSGAAISDGSFDCVYADNTLEHSDVDATLGEIRRVMRDGGVLLLLPTWPRKDDNHT
jgi:hypothetical protein